MKIVLHYLQVFLGLIVLGLGRAFEAFNVKTPFALGAVTAIGDLWTPAVWIPGVREAVTRLPSLINSGIVVRSPKFDEVAAGGGTQGDMPFFKEPDIADQPQVASTTPPITGLTSGKQICTILNREWAIGSDGIAGGVSGTDPVREAMETIAAVRLRQRQVTLLNTIRGVMGNAAAPGAGAAAFKSLRNDIFLEAGAAPASGQLFSSGAFADTTSVFGEIREKLKGGAVLCHSVIETAMIKQDEITFIKSSTGDIILRLYKGIPLFISDLLVRNGGTSGKVYDTYIFTPGAVAMGDKLQTSNVGDIASLTKKEDAGPNTVAFFDRTRFVMHPSGAKWVGAPAGQSATNAELATEGNWTLAYGDVKNAGVCCLRTNG